VSDNNTPVTVLGLGPMGRALAAAFLAAGRPTIVWNRTPRDVPGAVVAASPAEAAARSPLTVCCVVDYAAVREVLADRPQSTVVVNLTSGIPADARALAARGMPYLDGAILTPSPTVGTAAATVLYSGPRALFEEHRPALEAIGAAVYLGADVGAAAAYETALLDLFAMCVGGLVHAFALAGAEGIAPGAFARFASGIGALLPDMAQRFAVALSTGDYPGVPSSIASARSAVSHVRASAAGHGIDTGALDGLWALFDRAVAAGHGDEGYARLVPFLEEGVRRRRR
jgi:3-hydroxyisobutyrate dehydrogenase-like beta-hydroxyacid dehydrogenase